MSRWRHGPPAADGWPAEKVFDAALHGYNLDDIIFMPGETSFEANRVDFSGRMTKELALHTPFISAPLPSVTEMDMAVSMALSGGIGIIHRNQGAYAQAEMVRRVKRHMSGFIMDPFVMSPTDTVDDLCRLRREKGYGSVPITDNGKIGGKLLGIVAGRDVDLVEDRGAPLEHFMVTGDDLIVGKEPILLETARERLRRFKVGRMPIVDDEGRLHMMVTRTDLKRLLDFPRASRDVSGQLIVGASVACDTDDDWKRAELVCEAGANVLFVDTAVGDGNRQIGLIEKMKSEFPKVQIIVGPVCSCRMAKRLCEAGADAIRVGSVAPCWAPGGEVAAVGRTDASTIFTVSQYVRLNFGIPTIADCSLLNTGQVLKAFGLGVSAVVLDDLLSGTDETPTRVFVHNNIAMKAHHGPEPARGARELPPSLIAGNNRNSLDLAKGTEVRPVHVARSVQVKGPARVIVKYIMDGLKCGMRDLGVRSMDALHTILDSGELRMEVRTTLALQVEDLKKQAMLQARVEEVVPQLPPSILVGGRG
eukprot:TRINITY_DN38386_c0_g1_i1.p1 TRINITY_DN38386_c0_g1~~TRINITY_DN38386_c0_g1_i1.p1  ORF type:complete len:549 (-),score=120.84 TRINITY_DN38386_c0_g1_i1:73-1674(-)